MYKSILTNDLLEVPKEVCAAFLPQEEPILRYGYQNSDQLVQFGF